MSLSSEGLTLSAIKGVRLGAAGAGIKRSDRDDLLVIEAAEGSACAAVFTRNAFCAAPVIVAREHLAHRPRWLVINSGNANAGTGQRGLEDARRTCRALGQLTGARAEHVLPFSTGVIGEYLPLEKIESALPEALGALDEAGWARAARAIMTTDTRPKGASRIVEVAGVPVTVTGIAKGAGMIHPDMATMLAFIATDANVEQASLQACLSEAVDCSFNLITVDGDTSTNDACVLFATGAAGNAELNRQSAAFPLLAQAVREVCEELAEAIVRDGEGATKLMRIVVEEARNEVEARNVAKTIAHSPLVKTAFFASDPNWGRILAAVGRSGCADLDISGVSIWLGEVIIVEDGGRAASYTEEAGRAVMSEDEILIRVALGRGGAQQRVLTCDLSYDYVRINAEYRT
ncbi:bifunctional glutamate N-acetyltransferase/amino-acid acetyltransferase ArgJ [Methylocaldum sp.]|uniref:bifunctional glutamate N-acetyltransferase/amino-acid acetyltransferase ArgJ n=1 Tax=Methylocaldum sp. TaxID=1969727 RepID=UPI002D4A9FD2|nr:bifunctional glutamate N-acetyltransferase/amino-acid acetyltransferase ArgJ [Methylocaldum sp.]HYE35837.1 bifunctional glutamate N-acetyltransferase/amino-acid acetyltransferase ArgJ [Methylocaldum sp.]